ncbi:MAG: tetratricopeptide repeat protein, partial [Acidobacteria bacterium]|nr:tetratricopeptide repeat protein [Acidobacteriota bacterium]
CLHLTASIHPNRLPNANANLPSANLPPTRLIQKAIYRLCEIPGRFEEGLEPARKACEIRTGLRGEDHVETAADIAAYAALLDGLDRYSESRPLYAKALAIFEKHYGRRHYEIAVNLNNLGSVEWSEGNPGKARELFEESLSIKSELLGRAHPDTALTQFNLARLLEELGESESARALLGEALDTFRSALGDSHPHTVACAAAVAEIEPKEIFQSA